MIGMASQGQTAPRLEAAAGAAGIGDAADRGAGSAEPEGAFRAVPWASWRSVIVRAYLLRPECASVMRPCEPRLAADRRLQ
jgi:hypothetical protein